MKTELIFLTLAVATCLVLRRKRPSLPNREAVANEAERLQAVANAGELEPLEEDSGGWFKVAGYGVKEAASNVGAQHFDRADADKMVSSFNSLRGKLARSFRGVPIYPGHPDVDRKQWPDDRRLGKVVDLQAREDGLWARAEWNSLGKENREEGFWMYPSPYWDAPRGNGPFRPDRLISIGLTNTPRFKDSEPVANSAEQTAAQQSQKQTEDMNIRKKLGLPAEATDAEVDAELARVIELANPAKEMEPQKEDSADKKEPAEKPAEKSDPADEEEKEEAANSADAADAAQEEAPDELAAARAELAEARTSAANSLLDAAVAQGRVSPAERESWLPKLTEADKDKRAAAENSLKELKPKLNTTPLNNGTRREEVATADNAREAVSNAMEQLQGEGLSYEQAWAKCKKDTRFANFFHPEKAGA